MTTKNVSTWEELVDILKDIHSKYSAVKYDDYVQKNLILYRGLADSNWQLDTTLERHSKESWSIGKYYHAIYFCAPQIESFLGTSWDLRNLEDAEKNLSEKFSDFRVSLPHYDYWAYLRHHGFPSPLLDWSKSPYIALFFAFCEQVNSGFVSLYIYIESTHGGKGLRVGAPQITVQHPYVKTHKRHFLQQSYYTIATKVDLDSKDHNFVAHENVFAMEEKRQDILIKIVIPRSIRLKALSILDSYNINYFSLFQTEDSLIKTLSLKELELKYSKV
jgi:hypothetical protein